MIEDTSTFIDVDFLEGEIPTKNVIRRLGYPSGEQVPEGKVGPFFEATMKIAPDMIKPRAVYRILPVDTRTNLVITFPDIDFRIRSTQVAKMLRSTDKVIVFMVTIGADLEEKVKQLMDDGNMTEAVILDAIGSETADAAADKLHHDVLKNLAQTAGCTITPRFSPGYGDWPVTVQREILQVCGGSQIGISVNDSFLMQPRKSVSAVLGWKPLSQESS